MIALTNVVTTSSSTTTVHQLSYPSLNFSSTGQIHTRAIWYGSSCTYHKHLSMLWKHTLQIHPLLPTWMIIPATTHSIPRPAVFPSIRQPHSIRCQLPAVFKTFASCDSIHPASYLLYVPSSGHLIHPTICELSHHSWVSAGLPPKTHFMPARPPNLTICRNWQKTHKLQYQRLMSFKVHQSASSSSLMSPASPSRNCLIRICRMR